MRNLLPQNLQKSILNIISISLLFFVLRFPSLFEPYWYGDEGIYEVLGKAIRSGRILYSEIWDNKPPLLYLLYAIFDSDQFLIRAVSAIFGIAGIAALYYLIEKVFRSQKVSILGTVFFAILFGLPLLEGNIANAENFMLFPIIFSALLIYHTAVNYDSKNVSKKHEQKILFLAGIMLGVAFLFKIVAIFDFSALILFLIFTTTPSITFRKISHVSTVLKSIVKTILPMLIGFIAPLLVTTTYFIGNNALEEFLKATFLSNIGYVGYKNQFIIPQGLLVTKLILLSAIVIWVFIKRSKIPTSIQFIVLWLSFSLFNAFFSQRPYTHYTLVILPVLSILFSSMIVKSKINKNFLLLLFTATSILLIYSFHVTSLKKSFLYYTNFVDYVVGKKSTESYQSFFDSDTPRDYAIARFIKTHTKSSDKIFIWGNSAQIYVLSDMLPLGKYTVAYHISSYPNALESTNQQILEYRPKFIIQLPDSYNFPIDLTNYAYIMSISDSGIYERVY